MPQIKTMPTVASALAGAILPFAASGQCDYRAAVLASQPVAYWRLGEMSGTVAADEVGGHPGAYISSPALGQPGAIEGDADGCLFLSGDGSHMMVPDAPPLNFVSVPFSLEAWTRKSAPFGTCATDCLRRVIDKSHWGVPGGYGLDMNDNSIRTLGTQNTGPGVGSTAGLPYASSVGQWYHIVTTSDGEGRATTFVNGVEIGSDDYSSAIPWNTALRVGVADLGGGARFVGWIDEVAIYDHALSRLAAAIHYHAGSGQLGVFAPPLSRSTCPNIPVTFSIVPAGAGPFSHQWQTLGGPVVEWTDLVDGPNSIGGQFLLNAVGSGSDSLTVDSGAGGWTFALSFRCVVSNSCGTITSDPATLKLAPDMTTGAIPGSANYGVPNGLVNNDDFFFYLSAFAAGNVTLGDLTTGAVAGQPGYGVPNGSITNDDFFYFLILFAEGC